MLEGHPSFWRHVGTRLQLDVVEIVLLGLHFNGILLAHIALLMDFLLSVGCIVVKVHLATRGPSENRKERRFETGDCEKM